MEDKNGAPQGYCGAVGEIEEKEVRHGHHNTFAGGLTIPRINELLRVLESVNAILAGHASITIGGMDASICVYTAWDEKITFFYTNNRTDESNSDPGLERAEQYLKSILTISEYHDQMRRESYVDLV